MAPDNLSSRLMGLAHEMNAEQNGHSEPRSTKFKDAKGREWDTRLTLGIAKRIDASDFSTVTNHKFSFVRPDAETFNLLLTDTALLCSVVWVVVLPQTQHQPSIDVDGTPFPDPNTHYDAAEQEFADGLDGKAIAAMRDAFWESVCDFFPDLANALSILRERVEQGRETIRREMEKRGERLGTVIDRMIAESMETMMQRAEQEPKGEYSQPAT